MCLAWTTELSMCWAVVGVNTLTIWQGLLSSFYRWENRTTKSPTLQWQSCGHQMTSSVDTLKAAGVTPASWTGLGFKSSNQTSFLAAFLPITWLALLRAFFLFVSSPRNVSTVFKSYSYWVWKWTEIRDYSLDSTRIWWNPDTCSLLIY